MTATTADYVFAALQSIDVENCWEERKQEPSKSLNESLRKRLGGAETSYPDQSSRKCDVVFKRSDGATVWMEVKCSWTYSTESECSVPNKFLKKHLLSESPREHSALFELQSKLLRLIGRPEADYVGLLLVCFDSKDQPLEDRYVERLRVEGGLNRSSWSEHALEPWENPNNPRCRIRAFYWERPNSRVISDHGPLFDHRTAARTRSTRICRFRTRTR
jgi:hypothetical protein